MSEDSDQADQSPRRSPRVGIGTQVELRRRGRNLMKAKLLDVSSGGCKMEVWERLAEGETVWLRLPGLESVEARVAWSRDWTAGLEFVRPLHPAVVDVLVPRLKAK